MEEDDNNERLDDVLRAMEEGERSAIVAYEHGVVRGKLLRQIAMTEFYDLCADFVRIAVESDEGTTLESIVDQYIAACPDRTTALAQLEQLIVLLNNADEREQLMVHLCALSFCPESKDILLMHIQRLENVIVRQIQGDHLHLFDSLLHEAELCSQLPEGEVRRRRRQELFAILQKMSRDYRITYGTHKSNERRWLVETDNDLLVRMVVPPLNLNLRIADVNEQVRIFSLPLIVETLHRMKFQENLHDTLHRVDHHRIREETLIYGAKTANLREMERALPSLQQILKRSKTRILIPRFEGIPASVYDVWKEGQDIDNLLQPFYAWSREKEIFVRSSAVFSEDNDNATGAGIYHSERLPAHASFAEFKAAVIRVYESVDIEQAVRYQREVGVAQEKMGVTLQDAIDEFQRGDEYLNDRYERGSGYLNSSRAYAPNLMDVVTTDGIRPIFVKEKVQECFVNDKGGLVGDLFYYELDKTRLWSGATMSLHKHAVFLGYILEKAYGTPVQCEFVSNGNAIHLVQTRILPSPYRSFAHVIFPEEDALLIRNATGVLDEELDILPHHESNQQKKGIVIFEKSYFVSNKEFGNFFPKEGAVMIVAPSSHDQGHIETLCIERGLVCIFQSSKRSCQRHSKSDPTFDRGPSALGTDRNDRLINIVGIEGHSRLRVVANGFEARLYPARGPKGG